MKIFTACLLLISNILFSQEVKYIETEILIDTYLGKIDDKNCFYLENNLNKGKNLPIFYKNGTSISKFGDLPLEENTIQVFVFKNQVFSLKREVGSTETIYKLNSYNSSLQLIESSTLFHAESSKKANFEIKIDNTLLGIIHFTPKGGVVFMIDLESKKNNTKQFFDENLNKFSFSDFIFNDRLEANVMFELDRKSITNLPDRSSVVLISAGQSKIAEIQKIITIYDTKIFPSGFKFGKIDNDSFVIGALLKNGPGDMLKGYAMAEMEFGNEKTDNLKFILNDKLDQKKFWTEYEYDRHINGGYSSLIPFQRIKSIEIVEGNALFISEANRPEGPTPGGTQSGSNAPAASQSSGVSFMNYGDIIVSSINLDSKEVNWSNKTTNRFEWKGVLRIHYNPSKPCFQYVISDSRIDLYFDMSIKYLDGNVYKKANEGIQTSIVKSKIIVLPIDLSNGAGEMKLLESGTQEFPFERYLPNSYFLDENNKPSFITYELGKLNFQRDAKKYRFVNLLD